MDLVVLTGTCSECGCTEDAACEDDDGVPCHWVDAERTLCSACAPPPLEAFDPNEAEGYF